MPDSAGGGTPPSKLRVLIADDDEILRITMGLALTRRGHEVVQAASAHDAREAIHRVRFDVVVLDLVMPGDGSSLVEQLRLDIRLRDRTLVCTGLMSDVVDQMEDRGIVVLRKPFDFDDFVELVERVGGARPEPSD